MKIKKLKSISPFEVILIVFLTLLAIITIYPFYNVLITSIANTKSIAEHTPYLLPYVVDWTGYKTIMDDIYFYKALGVTVFITAVGTAVNMLLSVSGAYVLSKKDLIGRKVILWLVLFTMLFNGGLVPTYLVVKDYGLVNSVWSMILPCAISTYYMIIMKNYFMSLPPSLIEAAKIDGANEFTILLKVILPISLPFMATFALFYSVERWNEWWNALLYINQKSLMPLQMYLREVLINFNAQLAAQAQAILGSGNKVYMQSVQMATIVVATLPILCVYPFVQKHFVKGVMVGSVKE
ncbi:carbohydrate ABC transporter permease [Niameybacter massiliensis]|uniref:Carbohydrate ABC transporter permease n=1 Tax=Holtiella tumoricola TaxID=3018743 RepID=A0AA42DSG3_9FIRM|nr:carbohydrate ABC transporter permease [Holtiella tumoricola]MDA3734136.1 carbohydrate ABC transporter permease [Holtiella tumoricola]